MNLLVNHDLGMGTRVRKLQGKGPIQVKKKIMVILNKEALFVCFFVFPSCLHEIWDHRQGGLGGE